MRAKLNRGTRRLMLGLIGFLAAGLMTAPAGAAVVLSYGGTLATESPPDSVAIGDINGDGNPDVVGVASGLYPFLGDGAGRFTWLSQQGRSTAVTGRVVLADFQDDGKLDVAAAGGDSGGSVWRGKGDGTFEDSGWIFFRTARRAFAAGDVNADGRDDLLIGDSGGRLSVFLGRSDGDFDVGYAADLEGAISHLARGDLNDDGALDVVLATSGGLRVALGQREEDEPTGSFATPVSYATGADLVGIADLDGDTLDDDVIAIRSSAQEVGVRLGGAGGALGDETAYPVGTSVVDFAFADLDDDAVPDLALVDGSGSVHVLFGDGQGGLEDLMEFPAPAITNLHGIAAGDLNGDGIDDLITANRYHSASLGLIIMRNAPYLAFSTAEVDFGAHQIGNPAPPAEVLAGNLGVAPLEITTVAALGTGFGKGQDACSGSRLLFDEICAVEALFTPQGSGDFEGSLAFMSNDAEPVLHVWLYGSGPSPPVASPAPPPTSSPSSPTAEAAARSMARAGAAALRRLGLAGLARGRIARVHVTGPAGTIALDVFAAPPSRRSWDVGRPARRVLVARGRAELTAPGKAVIRVKPTRRGRRLARRSLRLTLVLRATVAPTSGSLARHSVRVTLRR